MDNIETTIRFAAQMLGCDPPDGAPPRPGTFLHDLRALLPRYEAGEITQDELYRALAKHHPGLTPPS